VLFKGAQFIFIFIESANSLFKVCFRITLIMLLFSIGLILTLVKYFRPILINSLRVHWGKYYAEMDAKNISSAELLFRSVLWLILFFCFLVLIFSFIF